MGCTYYVGDAKFDEEGFKRYLAEGGIEKLGVNFDELKYTEAKTDAQDSEYEDASNPFSDLPKEEAPDKALFNVPALVEMAKALIGDSPKIRNMQAALGRVFTNTKRMHLSPELFKRGNEETLAKVIAHEIGHVVDILGDTIKNTRLGAKIAALSDHRSDFLPFEPGAAEVLSEEDIARFQAEADQNVPYKEVKRKVDEEIEQEVGITPQDVIDIWNTVGAGEGKPALLEFIKRLSDAEKVAVVKQAMKGKLPPELEQFKETIKVKTGKKITVSEIIRSKASVQREFKRLMEEEIAKRKLWKEKELAKELYEFSTKTWRPVSEEDLKADPKLAKYRKDTKETFADALSALLVSPGTLKRLAPKFYEAFSNYAANHPEFDKAYTDALEILNAPESVQTQHLIAKIKAGFAEGARIRQEGVEAKNKVERNKSLLRQFVSRNFAVLSRMKGELFGSDGKLSEKAKVANDLEALNNVRGVQGAVMARLYGEIRRSLSDKEYEAARVIAFADRIIGARQDIANPLGMNGRNAENVKKATYDELTPDEAKRVKAELKKFRDNVFSVMQEAYDMDLFDTKEWDTVLSNKDNYVTFTPVDLAYKTVSAGMSRAKGSLDEVTDPFEQTTLKMISITSAAIRNKAITSMEDGLKQFGKNADDIIDATPRRSPSGEVSFNAAPEGKELVRFVRQGKPKGVYVPPDVAEIFKTHHVEELAILSRFNNVFKPLVTTYNLGFSLYRNPLMDNAKTIRSLASVLSAYGNTKIVNTLVRYVLNSAKSVKEAKAFAKGEKLTTLAEEMIKNNAVYRGAFGRYETNFVGAERELNSLVNIDFNKEGSPSSLPVLKQMGILFKTIELLPKFASYQTFKDYGFDPEAAGFYTRKYIGTPDFSDRGSLTHVTNQLLPFSNVIIQGMRSNFTLATNRKTAAGYWATQTLMTIPTAAMRLAMLGYLGSWLEEQLKKIDSYNRDNYICIPIYTADDGEVTFVTVPMDEMTRINHALIMGMPEGDFFDALKIGTGFTPSLSPLFEITGGVTSYLGTGNVHDSFKGRNVFNKDQELINKAEPTQGLGELTKWVVEKSGGKVLLKAFTYDPKTNETTESGMFLDRALHTSLELAGLSSVIKTTNRGLKEYVDKAAEEVDLRDAKIRQAIKDVSATVVAEASTEYSPSTADSLAEKASAILEELLMEEYIPDLYLSSIKEFLDTPSLDAKTAIVNKLKSAYGDKPIEELMGSLYDIQKTMRDKKSSVLSTVKTNLIFGNKSTENVLVSSLMSKTIDARRAALEKIKKDFYKEGDEGKERFNDFITKIRENNLLELPDGF